MPNTLQRASTRRIVAGSAVAIAVIAAAIAITIWRYEDAMAVPIVMLTGHTSSRDREAGVRLGVNDYIPEPFSPREVSARVRRTLPRAGH